MMLLQDIVPEVGSNGTVLAGLLALVTTLLSAYTLTQKGRLDDLRAAVTKCEDREKERVSKAESREDAALDRLGTATNVITALTAGINEFGGVLKDSVAELRRTAERSEGAIREIGDLKKEAMTLREATLRETADLKKEATALREATLRETADVKRDLSEVRRELSDIAKSVRSGAIRGVPE